MKNLYTFLAVILLTTTSFAQAPEKMSYQAVVRDATNALVIETQVGMQISILQGTTPVYVETQTPTTNINGLVTLEIGTGTPVTGTFAGIDWSTGTYFIKTETDPAGGTNYSITGTSQLLSVPYALHAKTADNTFIFYYDDLFNIPPAPTYIVNTFYSELGGYVIEVNLDGTHGLVVAKQDLGVTRFTLTNDFLSDGSNHDTNGAKFKDWRLPTKRELNLIRDAYVLDNGATLNLNGNNYWSSTEYSAGNAWSQNFPSGTQTFSSMNNNFVVCAVRAF